MKEKLSKLINVYKKYGFKGFCKKLKAYIIANYLDKISFKTIFNKGKYEREINDILLNNNYERIILWRSSFGYNVPLFQRPQHIANNLSKNKCLVFYEVTTMTDKVKIYKKYSNNLYLFNFNNKALNKILTKCLSNINKPKYIQLYSTDWKLSIQNIEWYLNNGYKFIYEYIDHISPVLSGTKDLPKNIISIHKTSNQTELAKLYTMADIFVNPTREDNFPTVNMEALACGTPVITYKTGGSPEAVDDKTGIVVEQGDVDALADAIRLIKESPLSSEACRKRAEEHFEKDKCFEEYIELYESLLK